MKRTISNYILNNKIINDYLSKIDRENKDDFRQHIYLIVWEMIDSKYDKVLELYNANELGKFIIGIINNQLKSNTSSYTKQYKDKRTTYTTTIEDEPIEEISDKINHTNMVKQVILILNNIYPVDSVLYKLYRGIDPITNELKDAMTYQEIQKLIGINYQAVRSSVMKTDKLIKERIKI